MTGLEFLPIKGSRRDVACHVSSLVKYEKLLFVIILLLLPLNHSFAQDGKLTYTHTFAPQEGFVNKIEKQFRQEICLNGLWEFQGMSLPEGYQADKGVAPELPKPQDGAWDKVKIKIPSPWNINAFATYNLEGPDHRNYPSYPKAWEGVKMAWMKKMVQIPSDWNNQRIRLHFEAVAGFAEVYVKGQKVAENFDIFLPFEADITDIVHAGEPVEIRVGVRNYSLFDDKSTVGRRIIPAGSMWGNLIAGIWQDVYLLAVPKINIETVFIKPLVSKNRLELDITLANHSDKKETITLSGDVKEWINQAGTDVNSAPVPAWELGGKALEIKAVKIALQANETITTTLQIPVENALKLWSPEHPNLYGLTLNVAAKNKIDTKYERFGWREWSIQGAKHCLNGQPYELKGDSWHFMGVPQLTRRYAWAWFTAIKAANGNAVRPHAQIYPRFYLDMADEMGICVLAETANWASDGGPKLDSPIFWENSKEHLKRMVLRDRNHASVFGWSISNENRPVILYVFKKPELMPFQEQAWKDWREIVATNDPTRPWISADGEDDGEGILPVTMGHYGDTGSMKQWVSIGKPWGVGEHSMAYYGTPQQVSKYNGERAYESQTGRMEGLANEVYHLIANQRELGASYVSVFNLAWYSLKPLPLGKKDLTTVPSLENDGIFFSEYKEGLPGIQPERIGPYSSTFNPGYDPNLPLYETWPMFDAIRSANANPVPAWSKWAEVKKETLPENKLPPAKYTEVLFIGDDNFEVKKLFVNQGIEFSTKSKSPQTALFILDGKQALSEKDKEMLNRQVSQGADCWIWGITPATLSSLNGLLLKTLNLEERKASSYLPVNKSWTQGMKNSDFYFCEIQQEDASEQGLSGDFVREGEVLLRACDTDWRRWNGRPEEIKTASVIRSERETKGANPVLVSFQQGNTTWFVSTLTHFALSDKGSRTLTQLLKNAGIPINASKALVGEISLNENGFMSKSLKDFWVWSPRPLDDLLIEPDMPKLNLKVNNNESGFLLNNQLRSEWTELPLKQGWNHLVIKSGDNPTVQFQCMNKQDFLSQLKISVYNPDAR
ncbi:MAG: Beta-glucuronidase [Candidatus Ordinivivax streblomastigis]|uniref:Beta-glucuronidase n=1 Tax=Candidatus Ordinivivax streblomastigis TaxID=2540710 RepID=A0A5M8P0P0_9BACT|nr:MAG: Beta-glucuronidase [Candidatus Ordinivivax streblomastigis]